MDIKERIEKAKERLEAAKNAKTKAETQLEAAQEQCDKVVEEMKQLGVTPDTIEAEITRLSESVEEKPYFFRVFVITGGFRVIKVAVLI